MLVSYSEYVKRIYRRWFFFFQNIILNMSPWRCIYNSTSTCVLLYNYITKNYTYTIRKRYKRISVLARSSLSIASFHFCVHTRLERKDVWEFGNAGFLRVNVLANLLCITLFIFTCMPCTHTQIISFDLFYFVIYCISVYTRPLYTMMKRRNIAKHFSIKSCLFVFAMYAVETTHINRIYSDKG